MDILHTRSLLKSVNKNERLPDLILQRDPKNTVFRQSPITVDSAKIRNISEQRLLIRPPLLPQPVTDIQQRRRRQHVIKLKID